VEWARLLGRQRGGWGGGLSSRDRAALVSNGDGARSIAWGKRAVGGRCGRWGGGGVRIWLHFLLFSLLYLL